MTDSPTRVDPLRQRAEQIARQLHTTGRPASELSAADMIEAFAQAVREEATRAERERLRDALFDLGSDWRIRRGHDTVMTHLVRVRCAEDLAEAIAAFDPGEGTHET